MPTDPTPTAADFEAARDLRNVVHRYSCGTVGIDVVDDALARAIATAREAGQDVEVGRRRRLIDRARAEADAAGYARGREESDKLTGDLQNLVRDTLIRSAKALGVEGADTAIDGGGSDGGEIEFTAAELSIGLALIEEAAEVRGRAEGLREAAGLARRVFGHADLHGLRDEMVRAIDRALTLTPPPTPEPTQPCCGCDSAEEPADCECADYCPHDGPCQCDCHRGPTPASGCHECGDSGSVPTGDYDETEERDERVTCPACDGDGGDAPESMVPLTICAAGSDGECYHPKCPQIRDGEPEKSGRHCPLDTRGDDDV